MERKRTFYNRVEDSDHSKKEINKRLKPASIFITKLHHMLEHDDDSPVVSWSADGTFFTIHSIQSFCKRTLPKYFASNFTSFKRQLNYYGFQKLNDEPVTSKKRSSAIQTVSYRHCEMLFLRGRADLLQNIKRTTAGTDPKVEAEEMKGKIVKLENQVTDLQSELHEMKMQMENLQRLVMASNKNSRMNNIEQSSLDPSPVHNPPYQVQNGESSLNEALRRDLSDPSVENWKTLECILREEKEMSNSELDSILRACSLTSVEQQLNVCTPACIEDDGTGNYESVFGL